MRFFYFWILLFQILFSTLASAFASEASFPQKHIHPYLERASDRTSLTLLAAGISSTLLTNPHDDRHRSEWRNYQKISKKDAETGDHLGTGAAGVFIVGAQYFFDSNPDHWVQHGRALIWGSIFTRSLKLILNRQRPGDSASRASLPSGHTSTSFVTATSLAYTYGWKAAVVAYPVATFVGLSRMSQDAHWSSDVVAGAFLGYIMGRASDYSTKAIQAGETVQSQVYPIFSSDLQGLGWTYSF